MGQPTLLLELGAILVGLALLSRFATKIGMPTIPLYLTAGLAFGRGGIMPLVTAEEFVQVGAEIGLILLLFMLGLEYAADELVTTLRQQLPIGLVNLVLNFTPGVAAGLLLELGPTLAIALGGVTYSTSSGIVAKLLSDQGWMGNRETPVVLSLLVIEDITVAVYLPIVGALLTGEGDVPTFVRAAVGVAIVVAVVLAATRIEVGVSRMIFSRSDESLLLMILGMTILIAGAAAAFGVSAAVAALLVGIVLSGPAAEAARGLLSPMRDLFAAIFFAFVGLAVDPSSIPPVLMPAAILAVLTLTTKFATGWIAARGAGVGPRGRIRAGALLIARGEFSIAIVGLAAAGGVVAGFEAFAISYVFVLAILGPLFTRFADPIGEAVAKRVVLSKGTTT